MLYHDVELHNTAEVLQMPGGGVLLQRVPEAVRAHLNPGARVRVRQPDNAEIRFLSGGVAQVTLSSEGWTDVMLFYGTFDGRQHFRVGPEPLTIEVPPPSPRLQGLDPAHWRSLPFSPRVRRLVLGGRRRDPVTLHDVRGPDVRPPTPDDVPMLRYMAYGTSITHGFDAEGPHLTYAAQTAWHLGADLINLGMAGSAHCEPELADYMASRDDWDIATLALSVNMQGFPLDQFHERVSYMVHAIATRNPDKPVACITLFPYFRDLGIHDPGVAYGGLPEEYRLALRDAVASCPTPNAHLIEGSTILTEIRGLTHDLIHPGDHGMIEMGRNLAARLASILAGCGAL